jgi:hypothetical protein
LDHVRDLVLDSLGFGDPPIVALILDSFFGLRVLEIPFFENISTLVNFDFGLVKLSLILNVLPWIEKLVNFDMVLNLIHDFLSDGFDQIFHSLFFLEMPGNDPDQSQAVHQLRDGLLKRGDTFQIKGSELTDQSLQKFDIVFGLSVFTYELGHGLLKIIESLTDGHVLTAAFVSSSLKTLLDGLNGLLGELLLNRTQTSVLFSPAINLSD